MSFVATHGEKTSAEEEEENGERVCPITMRPISEVAEGARFHVGPPDPTIYEVEALYAWVFGYHRWVYPHSRAPMPSADIDRLRRMHEALATPEAKEQWVAPRSSCPERFPDPVTDPARFGALAFQLHPDNPEVVRRTLRNLAAYFVRNFLDRSWWPENRPKIYMRPERWEAFRAAGGYKVREVIASYLCRSFHGYSLELIVVFGGGDCGDAVAQIIGEVADEGKTPRASVFEYQNRPQRDYKNLIRCREDLLFSCAGSEEAMNAPGAPDYADDLRLCAMGWAF